MMCGNIASGAMCRDWSGATCNARGHDYTGGSPTFGLPPVDTCEPHSMHNVAQHSGYMAACSSTHQVSGNVASGAMCSNLSGATCAVAVVVWQRLVATIAQVVAQPSGYHLLIHVSLIPGTV